MPNAVSISSGKSGVIRRKLRIRRAKSAAELRRGLRLKPATQYKIHDYLFLPNGLQVATERKLKTFSHGKLAVQAAAAIGL